jgi:hypothetical protein
MKKLHFIFLLALTLHGAAVATAQTISSISPANGAAYFSVTLSGTGLSGATAVKFNGLDAICFYAAPAGNQIIALAPAGTTTGTISVLTPSGTALSPVFHAVPGADPSSDFTTIDQKPQTYETNWCNSTGGTWGPHRRTDFYFPSIPSGIDPGDWARARVIAGALKWRYLPYQHHHIPAFDATTCTSMPAANQVGPGMDCSNFTAFVYQYTFNYSINSAIATQESDNATGRMLSGTEALLPGDLMFCMGSPSGPGITHVVIYVDPIHRIDEHGTGCDIRLWGSGGWPYDSWKDSRRPLDMINLTTGISDPATKESKGLKLYPNPANTILQIESTSLIQEVALFNTLGEEIFAAGNRSGFRYTCDVSSLPAGIYFVRIRDETGTRLRKISVVK